MTDHEHPTTNQSVAHNTGSTSAEAIDRKHNRSHPTFKRVAAGIGVLALVGGVLFVSDKVRDDRAVQRAEQKVKIDQANDAQAAAGAAIEQQRLSPKSARLINGLLKLGPNTVLSSSPAYVGKSEAPGTKIVPAGTTLVVLNPVAVGNTYQVGPNCSAPRANKFVSSYEIGQNSYWVKAMTVPEPDIFPGQPKEIKPIYNNFNELVDANNELQDCVKSFDSTQVDFLDRVASLSSPKK